MGAGVLEEGSAVMEPMEMGRGHEPLCRARCLACPSAWLHTSSRLTLPGWPISQHPKRKVLKRDPRTQPAWVLTVLSEGVAGADAHPRYVWHFLLLLTPGK